MGPLPPATPPPSLKCVGTHLFSPWRGEPGRVRPGDRPAADSPARAPETKLCECGCGQTFIPTRAWHRFKDASHRQRGWQRARLVSKAEAALVIAEEFDAASARIRARLRLTKGD